MPIPTASDVHVNEFLKTSKNKRVNGAPPMPYTINNVPENVQKMSATKKRQWVAIFNSAYARAKKNGKSDKEAETAAFKQANGVTMKAASDELAITQADIDVLTSLSESPPDASNDDGADGDSGSIRERVISTLARAFGWDDYGVSTMPEIKDSSEARKLAKAHAAANYRAASTLNQTCSDCISFCYMTCNLVEGAIDPKGYCDLFRPNEGMEAETNAANEHGEHELAAIVSMREEGQEAARLFIDLSTATGEDGWIQILPAPGSYTHPKYGKISVTKARNQRFVENIRNKVYDQQLPIDAEHAYKLSGAFGWINPDSVRLNDDHSVSAKPEWTERGHTALKEGRFKYLSPEWWDDYVQPLTDKKFKDVLIGAALTTRPFFKESSLQPIVYRAASEGGIFESPTNEEGEKDMPDKKPDENTPPGTGTGSNDGQSNTFAESQERKDLLAKIAELEKKESDSKTFAERFEAKEQEAKQLAERVERMESDSRRKRFSDMVMGRDGSGDGAPWIGGTDKHLNLLEKMAAQFGEGSEEFKTYVEMQTTQAAAIKSSSIFTEYGRPGTLTSGGDVGGEIDAKARKFIESDPALTIEQARVRVISADPSLYERYEKDRTGR
jgi:hypothetical protein